MASKRAPIDLKNVIAVNADGELDRSALLGKLVFYSISNDIRIKPDDLQDLFDEYDIDKKYFPGPLNPSQAFRSACRGFGKRPVAISGHNVLLEFTPALDTERGILFILDRTSIDRATISRVPIKVGQIGWKPDMPDQAMWSVEEELVDEYEYELIFEEVEEDFHEARSYYFGSRHIGPIIRKILSDTWSVDARPKGGVYIVPRDAIDLLERVEEMVNRLEGEYKREDPAAGGSSTEFNSIQIIDGQKERLFIKGKVEAQVREQLDRAIGELQVLMRSGGSAITQRQLMAAAEARAAALELRDHYKSIIGSQYAALDATLAGFEETMRAAVRLQMRQRADKNKD